MVVPPGPRTWILRKVTPVSRSLAHPRLIRRAPAPARPGPAAALAHRRLVPAVAAPSRSAEASPAPAAGDAGTLRCGTETIVDETGTDLWHRSTQLQFGRLDRDGEETAVTAAPVPAGEPAGLPRGEQTEQFAGVPPQRPATETTTTLPPPDRIAADIHAALAQFESRTGRPATASRPLTASTPLWDPAEPDAYLVVASSPPRRRDTLAWQPGGLTGPVDVPPVDERAGDDLESQPPSAAVEPPLPFGPYAVSRARQPVPRPIGAFFGLVALGVSLAAAQSGASTAPLVLDDASLLPQLPRATALAVSPPEASPSRFRGVAALVRDSWRDHVWFHPLTGERLLPERSSRRFGAARQGERPRECGRGHCGVDLGNENGLPVYAARDGVVELVVRQIHPRAGRYVRLHHDGGFRTDYLHLDSIRDDLQPGMLVRGGEYIASSGSTGVHRSEPHLHFNLVVSHGGKHWYIDPEPMLRSAVMVEAERTARR
jgi:murein DD-endopeptidase MepM/ murein hydrolase activator NlpD